MRIRSVYLFGFSSVCLLLLISIYLQFFKGLVPCPLCTMQRLSFALLGILFLFGILLYKKLWGRLLIHCLSLFGSLLGMFFSIRQIWLQHFPTPDNNECGVSLEYMLEVLPLNQALQKILAGSAECAQRGWEFLYLNMAEWALIWFMIFLLMTLYLFLKEFKFDHS